MSVKMQSNLEEPLSEAECERMEAILDSAERDHAMNAEEMDGFFAALICGPEAIAPTTYLTDVWGGGEAQFTTEHQVAQSLGSASSAFFPWLLVEPGEDLPRGNRWAEGFLKGVDHTREAWNEIFADENKFAWLLPMLALANEHSPDPEMRTWETPPDRDLREKLLISLGIMTAKIYNYFRSERVTEETTQAPGNRQAKRKIGRNEPCFCGSGKKYKRCCGDVTLQ